MSPDWITPQEQISIINGMVMKNNTVICLGDVGNPEYIKDIKARKKILILGNHDAKGAYKNCFDEIYTGPLFIAEKNCYHMSLCTDCHGALIYMVTTIIMWNHIKRDVSISIWRRMYVDIHR